MTAHHTWLFDLGNTRLKCAPLVEGGGPGVSFGVDHDGARFADALDTLLPARIEVAVVSSVAASE